MNGALAPEGMLTPSQRVSDFLVSQDHAERPRDQSKIKHSENMQEGDLTEDLEQVQAVPQDDAYQQTFQRKLGVEQELGKRLRCIPA